MEELELYLDEAKERMNKSLVHVANELSKIRAGKASPAMIDGVMVSYYGAMTPHGIRAAIVLKMPKSISLKPLCVGTDMISPSFLIALP